MRRVRGETPPHAPTSPLIAPRNGFASSRTAESCSSQTERQYVHHQLHVAFLDQAHGPEESRPEKVQIDVGEVSREQLESDRAGEACQETQSARLDEALDRPEKQREPHERRQDERDLGTVKETG